MGALRFHEDGGRGGIHCMRFDREDSQRADDVNQMEDSPSRPQASLLLDRVP
jgi:hypothetical protein